MSQAGAFHSMNERTVICVTEYFIKDRGIDIPDEWLEDHPDHPTPTKVLRLMNFPEKKLHTMTFFMKNTLKNIRTKDEEFQ